MPDLPDFEFDFEFLNETDQPDAELYDTAYEKITDLAEGHTDIVGAKVSMMELSDDTTPHAYEAKVVLYVRPNNLFGSEKKPDALDALQGALDDAIRQVREKREKLRNY
ncbi:HPF/RaiA family ribosome-associated protein [bacterium]|nr:HPF/RaiA family ribosome-associated protein [bacterium]